MMLNRRGFTGRVAALSMLGGPALAAPHIARTAAGMPAKIRLGVASAGLGGRPYSLGSAISVVHVRGLLEKAFSAGGTAIEWQFYAGAGPAVNEALANGALDFAWQGDLPQYVARSRGLATRQILVDSNRNPVLIAVAKASPIDGIAALKGKTVANFQGTSLQLSVDRLLATAGLTEADLQIVNLDQMTALEAVMQNQIDATFLALALPPRAEDALKVIYRTGRETPELTMQASLLATDAFTKAYPEAVDRVARVCVDAAYFVSLEKNRAATYAIWEKSGYPPGLIEAAYDPDDLKTFSSPLWDPFQVAQLARSAADCYKFGLIRTPVDTSNWIDHGPLDRAVAAAGLSDYWPQFGPDGVTRLG